MRWKQRNVTHPQANSTRTNTMPLMRNDRNKTTYIRTMRPIQTSQKKTDNTIRDDLGNVRSPLGVYSNGIMPLFIKVPEISRQIRKTNITED